jgi:class 3 adenylate cyclase
MSELPGGTLTVLHTEIEASTCLTVHLGDRYPEVLAAHRALLRAAFAAHKGHEVDTQGDSFFVVFPRATQAVAAAVAIQRALTAETWPEGGAVRVRIGLHTGEPIRTAEGYTGLDVIRGARIRDAGHGGEEINVVGDEILAVFDGAVAAIRCGCTIHDAVQGLGIAVKVGIHAGEVEYDDRTMGGITVIIGARITGAAQPGEVLVSNTVKELVTGSGVTFTDRGTHIFKGLPGEWRLFTPDVPEASAPPS